MKIQNLLTALLLVLTFFSSSAMAGAGYKVEWEQTIGTNSIDYSIAVDLQDNVIAVGMANNGPLVVKREPVDGTILWTKQFSGVHLEALAIDSAGNVFVAGYDSTYHAYVVALNPSTGEVVWSFSSSYLGDIYDIKVSDGFVVIAGKSAIHAYVAKINSATGVVQWEHTRTGSSSQRFYQVAIDSYGDVYAVGGASGTYLKFWTQKINGSTGAVLWEDKIDTGGRAEAWSVATDASGNVLSSGFKTDATGNVDAYAAKYSPSGLLLWDNSLDLDDRDEFWFMGLASNGDLFLTGQTRDNPMTSRDCFTVRLSGVNGQVVWQDIFDDGGSDTGYWLDVSSADDVAIMGDASSGNMFVRKYSGVDGAVLWHHEPNSIGFQGGYQSEVKFDSIGRVVFVAQDKSDMSLYMSALSNKK